jgi:NAD(P)H-quinone oxidoreductase subunit 5
MRREEETAMPLHDIQESILRVWLCTWELVALTGLAATLLRQPERMVRWHVRALVLPVLAAVGGLGTQAFGVRFGPWRADGMGWLMALYIAALGLVIQRFTIRYLYGDRHYGAYFGWLTWTTGAASITWMSGTLWLQALSWVAMDAGLIALIAMARESAPVRAVAALTIRRLLISGVAVVAGLFWYGMATGSGDGVGALARAQTLDPGVRAGVAVLLVLAAVVQAGGWPFGRWLLESAVTPTPVSAVMHAGLVNAGALLLTRWAPLLNASGPWPRALLLAWAWISVGLGTGILLVHVDYKRQLIASTMAQTGLMLMQCAIGAYDAAVVHLILHGVFKATLFLRSGFALPRPAQVLGTDSPRQAAREPWPLVAGVVFAAVYGAAAPHEWVRAMSALMLGAGMALAARQLRTVREGRWLGLLTMLAAACIAEALHTGLAHGVQTLLGTAPLPAWSYDWGLAAVLLLAGLALLWVILARSPESAWVARVYLWLVHHGDPRPVALETHPRHLARFVKEAVLR